MQLSSDATVKSVDFSNGHLVLVLSDGFRLKQPMSRYPALAQAPLGERAKFSVEDAGKVVLWPSLGVRLELQSLRRR